MTHLKAVTVTSRQGYQYDNQLSNHNEQVWFHPDNKKLLHNVTGTHNLKDWGTDLWLAAGGLRSTNRFKEADRTLKAAKAKYNVNNATISGHSLGGSVGQAIKKDKLYTQLARSRGIKMAMHIILELVAIFFLYLEQMQHT